MHMVSLMYRSLQLCLLGKATATVAAECALLLKAGVKTGKVTVLKKGVLSRLHAADAAGMCKGKLTMLPSHMKRDHGLFVAQLVCRLSHECTGRRRA